MQLNSQQIAIGHILDVEAIEHELATLWKDCAAEKSAEESKDEFAVMRARVANLIIFTPDETQLDETNATLDELSAVHPSRALVVVAERRMDDRDIELFVSSYAQTDNRGGQRLCCEEVVLVARGKFVPELTSAAVPLLISDLPTFLWWRDRLELGDRTFADFVRATDRLVVDTAEADDAQTTLLAMARLFGEQDCKHLGISDINWARLTSWRALLASFYDAPHSRAALSQLANVVIEYSAPQDDPSAIAPQALLIAGWLASRLGWQISTEPVHRDHTGLKLEVEKGNRRIRVELVRVDRPDIKPGRLARAQLATTENNANFVVLRHENGLHLETQVTIEGVQQPGRVLPVRNRSRAQLLGRELEILCNDNIYAEAVKLAAQMIRLYSKET